MGIQRAQGAKSTTRRPQRQRSGRDQGRGAPLPTSDIVLENMTISSQDDAEAWTKAQWVANARGGFRAQSTAGGPNTKCISLTGSHISNVRTGAGLFASQLLFSNNQIDHFGDDGIDFAASNIAITHNDLHDNLGIVTAIMRTPCRAWQASFDRRRCEQFPERPNRQQPGYPATDPEFSFPTYLQGSTTSTGTGRI